jgi:tetratricopeptide (TPR) repeat protein
MAIDRRFSGWTWDDRSKAVGDIFGCGDGGVRSVVVDRISGERAIGDSVSGLGRSVKSGFNPLLGLKPVELAIEQFEKCVAISESGIHRRYTIGSYHCLSFLYSAIGFENKSIDFANKFFKEIDLDNLSTWSLGYRGLFLGRAYINLLNFQKALEMYKNALTYAEEIKYPQVKGNSFIGLAIIARIEKNWNQANFHHHSSIDILRNLGAKSDLAEAYFQFGLTYQAMGDDRQAEDYKEKALDLFGQMQAPKQIDRVHRAFEQGAINRSPLQ